MRAIKHIVIHCSASKNGDGSVTRDVIDEWHRERGWAGIGYHYVIEVDGQVQEGRPEERIGAHVEGHNIDSLGICMVGTDQFTPAQWNAVTDLINQLRGSYPSAKVLGHRDFPGVKKTCPGFDVTDWMENDKFPKAENVLS